MTLEEQKELERAKADYQLHVEYHKLVIENAMRAQRGLLLCHGGAITAIVMSGQKGLLPFCLWFGLGAALVVLSSGLGYAANYCYMNTWDTPSERIRFVGKVFHALAVMVYLTSVGLLFRSLMEIFDIIGS
ncbi:MAG: hypothetical protein IKW19_00545 [Akkermansia sp.]|nr:hypothetical protein [Akkermansia sp.]